MAKIVTGIGVLMILMAVWVAFAPDHLISVMDWDSRSGQNLAGGMRIVLGALLMVGAPATRYPKGLRIFGSVVVVAGLAVLVLPAATWSDLIGWWLNTDPAIWRVAGGLGGLAIGWFFIHAARVERFEAPPSQWSRRGRPTSR